MCCSSIGRSVPHCERSVQVSSVRLKSVDALRDGWAIMN